MLAHILKDPWSYISAVMIIAVQWVMTHVNVLAGLLMAIGGVVTLIYRIIADRKKNELLDIEIKIKQAELDKIKNKDT